MFLCVCACVVLLQEGVLRACLEDGDSWLPLEALLEDVEGLHCMDTSLDEHDGGQVRQTQRQEGQGGWAGGEGEEGRRRKEEGEGKASTEENSSLSLSE